ncbi:MAG: hypothetical protein WC819_00060 [Parcubacteria group bacterium]|jgi:hypothetical protein
MKECNYEKMIIKTSDLVHEKFKVIYAKKNNGTRVKITTDQEWIKCHKTNLADLAKLCYDELPEDWKKERWCGSKAALDEVLAATREGRAFDEEFIERAAFVVHEDWLIRNINRAEKEHRLSYQDLSEDVKEKDRIFVHAAIEILQENLT